MYMPGGGLVRLRESVAELAESEAKIAEFILEHPAEFVNLTVQELAQRSGGSPAAVVRLWKSLGFDGYHDFKLRVASDLQSRVLDDYVELTAGSSFGTILHSIEDSHIQSIQNTLRLLKESDVQEAAQMLMQAKRTLTFGVGASGVVAGDFAQKLLRVGFPVHAATDFHTAAVVAAQLEPGDVLVAVSYSGQTSDVYEVAEIAHRNGVNVIAITRFGETPLSRIATLRLYISAVEPQVRVAATASRSSALVIIDTLFVYLANQHHNQVYDALEVTRNVVKSHKLG
ncbi:MAG: MurR/RpiR family transcriptional regulator [Alicyclobacillus sp.]|nr:MurR/RpiR family transcriptional regulator [Alicyclobacillus sp.]